MRGTLVPTQHKGRQSKLYVTTTVSIDAGTTNDTFNKRFKLASRLMVATQSVCFAHFHFTINNNGQQNIA